MDRILASHATAGPADAAPALRLAARAMPAHAGAVDLFALDLPQSLDAAAGAFLEAAAERSRRGDGLPLAAWPGPGRRPAPPQHAARVAAALHAALMPQLAEAFKAQLNKALQAGAEGSEGRRAEVGWWRPGG